MDDKAYIEVTDEAAAMRLIEALVHTNRISFQYEVSADGSRATFTIPEKAVPFAHESLLNCLGYMMVEYQGVAVTCWGIPRAQKLLWKNTEGDSGIDYFNSPTWHDTIEEFVEEKKLGIPVSLAPLHDFD